MDRTLAELNASKIREYSPAIAFSALVVLAGVLGNSLSVLFYGWRAPRTPTNLIIAIMASVDLFTCVILSDEIVELCFTVTFKNLGGCRAMYFFNHWLVLTSGMMLLFVAIDRYRKICRPLRKQFTLTSVKITFLCIVTLALLLSVRDWIILDVVRVNVTTAADKPDVLAYYCTHSDAASLAAVITTFHLLDLLVYLIVMSGLVLLYSLITRTLWKSRQRFRQPYSRDTSSTDSPSGRATGDPPATGFRTTDPSTADLRPDMSTTITCPQSKERKSTATLERAGFFHAIDNQDITTECETEISDVEQTSIDRYQSSDNPRNIVNTVLKDEPSIDKKRCTTRANVQPHLSPYTKVERKVTLMMITITAVSAISFVPYFVINLAIKPFTETSDQEFSVGIQVALRSYMINNAVNPYIIGMFNQKFRCFVKNIVFRCKRQTIRKTR